MKSGTLLYLSIPLRSSIDCVRVMRSIFLPSHGTVSSMTKIPSKFACLFSKENHQHQLCSSETKHEGGICIIAYRISLQSLSLKPLRVRYNDQENRQKQTTFFLPTNKLEMSSQMRRQAHSILPSSRLMELRAIVQIRFITAILRRYLQLLVQLLTM